MNPNWMRYSIRDEWFTGVINQQIFGCRAFSGGGRGSTQGHEREDLAHWRTNKKAPKQTKLANRGGPLPTGDYTANYVAAHAKFGRCVRLDQGRSARIHPSRFSPTGWVETDRDGFYIHGRGPLGSDGCIVPANPAELQRLLIAMQAVRAPVPLLVHGEGMNADRIDVSKAWAHMA